jgi:hypothetical protein
MPTLADALRVVNELETAGAIPGYAIGGAMAMLFWAEPTVTFGTPVQFLVSPNALADEAIATAAQQELDGVPFRVVSRIPRGALVAGRGAKRRERVALLRQADVIDESRLAALLQRHGIQSS